MSNTLRYDTFFCLRVKWRLVRYKNGGRTQRWEAHAPRFVIQTCYTAALIVLLHLERLLLQVFFSVNPEVVAYLCAEYLTSPVLRAIHYTYTHVRDVQFNAESEQLKWEVFLLGRIHIEIRHCLPWGRNRKTWYKCYRFAELNTLLHSFLIVE